MPSDSPITKAPGKVLVTKLPVQFPPEFHRTVAVPGFANQKPVRPNTFPQLDHAVIEQGRESSEA